MLGFEVTRHNNPDAVCIIDRPLLTFTKNSANLDQSMKWVEEERQTIQITSCTCLAEACEGLAAMLRPSSVQTVEPACIVLTEQVSTPLKFSWPL